MRSGENLARYPSRARASSGAHLESRLIRPEQEVAGREQKRQWFACRTHARAEKVVDIFLNRNGIESYLPLIEEERQWSDRRKRVRRPLFPGYLFVRASLPDLPRVSRAPRFLNLVSLDRRIATPLRCEEIAAVRRLVDGANEVGRLPSPEDYLRPGEPVCVTEGPFEGLEGVLIEDRCGSRVAVKIDALQAARAVEIDRSALRPLAHD